jgi:hypothetical protein
VGSPLATHHAENDFSPITDNVLKVDGLCIQLHLEIAVANHNDGNQMHAESKVVLSKTTFA